MISWDLLQSPGASGVAGVLLIALGLATASDRWATRVPNTFSGCAIVAGLAVHGWTGGG